MSAWVGFFLHLLLFCSNVISQMYLSLYPHHRLLTVSSSAPRVYLHIFPNTSFYFFFNLPLGFPLFLFQLSFLDSLVIVIAHNIIQTLNKFRFVFLFTFQNSRYSLHSLSILSDLVSPHGRIFNIVVSASCHFLYCNNTYQYL